MAGTGPLGSAPPAIGGGGMMAPNPFATPYSGQNPMMLSDMGTYEQYIQQNPDFESMVTGLGLDPRQEFGQIGMGGPGVSPIGGGGGIMNLPGAGAGGGMMSMPVSGTAMPNPNYG
jgi:hypothetical protein